jgi:hypothetical protein
MRMSMNFFLLNISIWLADFKRGLKGLAETGITPGRPA